MAVAFEMAQAGECFVIVSVVLGKDRSALMAKHRVDCHECIAAEQTLGLGSIEGAASWITGLMPVRLACSMSAWWRCTGTPRLARY